MRVCLLAITAFLSIGNVAFAAQFVVELEAVVFKRDITADEKEAIHVKMNKLPRASQGRFFSKESFRVLLKHAAKHANATSTFICDQSEPISWSSTTSKLKTEAQVRIHRVIDGECEVDVNWGLVFGSSGRSTALSMMNTKLKMQLDNKQVVGGGGSDGVNIVLAVAVREATQEDLQLIEKPLMLLPMPFLPKRNLTTR